MFEGKVPAALPPGDASVACSYHGTAVSTDGEVRHVVFLGIGRPEMQETEDGVLLAVHSMTPAAAINLAQTILTQVNCVLGHQAGFEDCTG
jgi:hypothetical protein